MAQIYSVGIRHVLNLRRFISDEAEVKGLGLMLHQVEMSISQIKDIDYIKEKVNKT